MQIKLYSSQSQNEWDSFVQESKNGTFLHNRNYMDYHADRFNDYSLMMFDDKERLIALLPANKTEGAVYSHQGLTYGGIITDKKMTTPLMIDMFSQMRNFLKEQGFNELFYKTIPSIYHKLASDEDQYALFLNDAELIRRDTLSVIINNTPVQSVVQNRRKRGAKKANKKGVVISNSNEMKAYWEMLTQTLNNQHETDPVHSLDEIKLLQSHFPENIKLYVATDETKANIFAGVLIYETSNVAHAQYIAASDEGRNNGALDLLFIELTQNIYKEKPYFDFGISNEDSGRFLNVGLVSQKEGFGARTICHDHYKINL